MAKYESNLDAMFRALADPTRRDILHRLMAGPATVSDLAAPFDMALPTVMQHIGALERGGLLISEKRGRTRICRANVTAIDTAADWLSEQRAIWEARLDRLEAYLETMETEDGDRSPT